MSGRFEGTPGFRTPLIGLPWGCFTVKAARNNSIGCQSNAYAFALNGYLIRYIGNSHPN